MGDMTIYCTRSAGKGKRCQNLAVCLVRQEFRTYKMKEPTVYWTAVCANHIPANRETRPLNQDNRMPASEDTPNG